MADVRIDQDPGHRPNVTDLSLCGCQLAYLTRFGEDPPTTVSQMLANIVDVPTSSNVKESGKY